jgi:hypothetical protein
LCIVESNTVYCRVYFRKKEIDSRHSFYCSAWTCTRIPRKASLKKKKRKEDMILILVNNTIALFRQEEYKIWELDSMPSEELEKYPVNKIDWEEISDVFVN